MADKEASPMLVRRTTGESGSASLILSSSKVDVRPAEPGHLSPTSVPRGKSQKQLLEARSDPLPDDGDEPGASSEVEKASESQSVFNLVNAVLGAGVLGYPWAYKSCGFVLATVLVLVTLVASELSMRLLMISSQLAGKRSYDDLARHCFGRVGQHAVNACVIIMNVGSLVAYLNILADMFSSVAGTIIPPGAEPSRDMLLLGITVCGPLPVALFVRSPQLLSAVSQASVAFLFFFCAMIALMALSSTQLSGKLGSLTWWQWDGMLVAFPVVAYGFTAHQILFNIYSSMRSPSLKRMTGVIQKSMFLSSAVYIVVGACGYLAFGQRASGDMLRNFGGPSVTGMRLLIERLLKVGYGVSILATVPLILIPLHSAFAPLVNFSREGAGAATLTMNQEYGVTAGVLGAALAMAVLLPNVEYVFGLAGSTASVLLGFIMPAAIFLRATSSQRGMLGHSVDMLRGSALWKQRRRMAASLLCFGLLAGVACTRALLLSIQEEAEVVQLAQQLVREEAKVIKATETEMKAKEVVETIGAVAVAAEQLNSAQIETSATLGVVMRATEELDRAHRPKDGSKKAAERAHKELTSIQAGVDKTLQKLEDVTASLGVTAKKLKNDTANLTSIAAAIVKDTAEGVQVALDVGPPGQEGPPAAQNTSSSTGEEQVKPPDARREAVVEAEQRLEGAVAAKAAAQEQPKLEETAHTIHSVFSAANDTLHVVKQSKAALEAVQQVAGSKQRKGGNKSEELNEVIRNAVNATGEAAAKMNATVQALRQVEATQKEELLSIVTRLAEDEGREEAARTAAAKYQQQVVGRKEALAGGRGGSAPGAEAAAGGEANSTATARPAADGQRARDALKQISGGDGKEVNVTQVAQTAIDVAVEVVQTAKATVEQSIEKRKSGVAVRAIEIAKELTGGSTRAPGADATSDPSSVIHAAALQAQEKSKNEQLPAANGTSLQAGAGTALAAEAEASASPAAQENPGAAVEERAAEALGPTGAASQHTENKPS